MAASWKAYQGKAAEHFILLGLNAATEVEVKGVRTKHEVDVLVTGLHRGLPLKWVVECKDWKTSIPKEKVMALQSIIQDVGADKGFLLSEVGFQAGAIKAAANTNITLTSLAELRANRRQTLNEEIVKDLQWRLSQAMKAFQLIFRKQKNELGFFNIPMIFEKSKVMFLDDALEEGLQGKFPTIYAVNDNKQLSAATFEELIVKSNELIANAEKYISEELKSG